MRRMCNKRRRAGYCLRGAIIIFSVLACLLGYDVVSAFQHTSLKNHIIPRHQPDGLQWISFPRRQSRQPFVWKPLYGVQKDAWITEQNKEYLMKRFGFTEDKLHQIHEWNNMLTLDIGVIGERIDWLENRLKLKENELKKIIASQPFILSSRSQPNLAPKLDYLQDRLGLDEKQLKKMIVSRPGILIYGVQDNMEPTLDWLQQRLDLDDEELSQMIKRQPSLIGGYSVTDSLEPKLNYLQDRLLLDAIQLRKLIFRAPRILSFSIKENIKPTLDWLQHRFDMMDNNAAFCKIIRTHPNIMYCSVKNNLEPTWKWFQKRLGLDDAATAKTIRNNPSILWLSIDDNLQPKLTWIQESLSLTDEGLSEFIQKQPSILGYSVTTNLEPTLEFYIDALKDEQKAVAALTRSPRLFGYSLEKRLKPRLKEVKQVGIPVDISCVMMIGNTTDNAWYAYLSRNSPLHG